MLLSDFCSRDWWPSGFESSAFQGVNGKTPPVDLQTEPSEPKHSFGFGFASWARKRTIFLGVRFIGFAPFSELGENLPPRFQWHPLSPFVWPCFVGKTII